MEISSVSVYAEGTVQNNECFTDVRKISFSVESALPLKGTTEVDEGWCNFWLCRIKRELSHFLFLLLLAIHFPNLTAQYLKEDKRGEQQ